MKTMLITGGSRGIGRALAEHFKDTYNVVTVARSEPADIVGDLKDGIFRDYLIETQNPDILINCAGIIHKEMEPIIETNFLAPLDLLDRFYKKMDKGHIINVGSIASTVNGYTEQHMPAIYYILSKKALHEASYFYADIAQKPIKVTSLEIASTKTSIQNRFTGVDVPESEYEEQTWYKIPFKAQDIVDSVDWILNLPQHMFIRSIQIDNAVNPKGERKQNKAFWNEITIDDY